MLDVERWAELRREHFVRGVPIKELVRRTGLSRNTVRAALRSDRAAGVQGAGAAVEAGSVQGRDPPAVEGRSEAVRACGCGS